MLPGLELGGLVGQPLRGTSQKAGRSQKQQESEEQCGVSELWHEGSLDEEAAGFMLTSREGRPDRQAPDQKERRRRFYGWAVYLKQYVEPIPGSPLTHAW